MSAPPWVDEERLRRVHADDPLRVLISSCLLGHATGWEGGSYADAPVVRLAALPTVRAVHFCPEDATLGTPRPLTTIHGGHGVDVLRGRARVLETTGRDVTPDLVRSASRMLELARQARVELALLLDVSDSCGRHAIYLGDPGERRYQQGPGVAAAMLMEAGIPVVAQRDHATMGRLLAALDPGCVVDPEARDFPDDPWFRAYFAAGPVGLPLAEFERSWRPRGRAAGSAVEGGA